MSTWLPVPDIVLLAYTALSPGSSTEIPARKYAVRLFQHHSCPSRFTYLHTLHSSLGNCRCLRTYAVAHEHLAEMVLGQQIVHVPHAWKTLSLPSRGSELLSHVNECVHRALQASVSTSCLTCGCGLHWAARGARCPAHWRHMPTASGRCP
jgi:hypothetical protein